MILDDIFQNDTSSLAEKTDLGPHLGTKRDQGRVLRKWRKSRLGEQDSQDMAEAMKPSDIPTVMRTNRLTMRDIEKERPQGAYRFRVGDNEFMDLDAAREFARGTGETVKPIRETVKKKLADKFADVSESGKPLDITEKKKPVPTNKPLWGRAKAAARSKFDVYPSAYANAWAAKWYKSHGGGWRMGKGAKK